MFNVNRLIEFYFNNFLKFHISSSIHEMFRHCVCFNSFILMWYSISQFINQLIGLSAIISRPQFSLIVFLMNLNVLLDVSFVLTGDLYLIVVFVWEVARFFCFCLVLRSFSCWFIMYLVVNWLFIWCYSYLRLTTFLRYFSCTWSRAGLDL